MAAVKSLTGASTDDEDQKAVDMLVAARLGPVYHDWTLRLMKKQTRRNLGTLRALFKAAEKALRKWETVMPTLSLKSIERVREAIAAINGSVPPSARTIAEVMQRHQLQKLKVAPEDEWALDDAWLEPIKRWVADRYANPRGLTGAEILAGALDITIPTRATQSRLGRCMATIGWKHRQFRAGRGREYRYCAPDPS